MIVHAIQTVLSGDLASKVSVKGIIAPFDSLGLFSPVYKDRAGPNVLALLGNTLGNMSDDLGFLETLHASMWSGDCSCSRCAATWTRRRATPPGIGEDAKKRFNFGPLEDLGAVYEDHRDLISIRRERSRSVIPNTVTTVTHCERVTCGDKTWSDVRLAYVHEYSEPDLERVVTDIGFTILAKFPAGCGASTRNGWSCSTSFGRTDPATRPRLIGVGPLRRLTKLAQFGVRAFYGWKRRGIVGTDTTRTLTCRTVSWFGTVRHQETWRRQSRSKPGALP